MMKEEDYGVPLDNDMQARISTMAVAGALCGQLIFGVLGDWFGRRSVSRRSREEEVEEEDPTAGDSGREG